MSTITKPTTFGPPFEGFVPYRMPLAQYEAMVASGAFTKRDRLELIEGLLVQKMTKGRKHSAGSEKCWRAIDPRVPGATPGIPGSGWHIRIEKPVRIPARESMPEPDVSVARGVPDDYLDLDPGPSDVALVVEVADSSLEADRQLAVTYGAAGIPVYWIINITDRQLEVYSNPSGGAYPAPVWLGESESVDLIVGGQVVGRIAVADLLPRRGN